MSNKRCAECGGKLGPLMHRHWSLRFCRLACKKLYLHKLDEERRAKVRWFAFLARGSP
jgi:hypothetical protein